MKSKDEINKIIHERLMGKCWHDFQNDCICQKPGCSADNSFRNANPDYCSDDSPRRLLRDALMKVMEQDDFPMIQALTAEVRGAIPAEDRRLMTNDECHRAMLPLFLEATAGQLSRAIVAVIESEKENADNEQ